MGRDLLNVIGQDFYTPNICHLFRPTNRYIIQLNIYIYIDTVDIIGNYGHIKICP